MLLSHSRLLALVPFGPAAETYDIHWWTTGQLILGEQRLLDLHS